MNEDYEEDAFEDEDEEEENYEDDEFEETGTIKLDTKTIESLGEGHKRYKPWQEKALRLLDHSKDTFDYDIVVSRDQKLLFDLQDDVRDETKANTWTTLKRMKNMIVQAKKGNAKTSGGVTQGCCH